MAHSPPWPGGKWCEHGGGRQAATPTHAAATGRHRAETFWFMETHTSTGAWFRASVGAASLGWQKQPSEAPSGRNTLSPDKTGAAC